MQMREGTVPQQAGDRSGRMGMYYAALLAEAYRKAGQTVEGLNVATEALARAHQSWGPSLRS